MIHINLKIKSAYFLKEHQQFGLVERNFLRRKNEF